MTHSFWEDKCVDLEERMIVVGCVGQLVDLGAESELESGLAPASLLKTPTPTLVAFDV